MEVDTCATCKFWTKRYEDTNFGECRLNPPVFVHETDIGGKTKLKSKFPSTVSECWCGKHEHKGHDEPMPVAVG